MNYPVSDHYNGRHFFNLDREEPKGLLDVLKWSFTRKSNPWPASLPTNPPREISGITVIGHSTALIRIGGLHILTDPIWSERASPLSFLGPRRSRAPSLQLNDLPQIDVILLSHNHYDHLDLPSLRYFIENHRSRVVTTLGVAKHVPGGAQELDWWQSEQLSSDLRVTCVPAKHFSARTPFDRNRSLWCGFVLQTPATSIYFAADTAWGDHFVMIRERLGSPDIALLPIGAYEPRWMMSGVHMNPEEAVRAHQVLGARESIAIHYGTFPLADEGPDDPARGLQEALRANPQERPFFL